MNLELFIARKIHFNKEGDRQATPPAIRIAMIGIALGLAVMILSVAIVIGFKKEVRNKVIGFGTHIQISNFDNNTSYETIPIAFSDTLLQAFKAERFIPNLLCGRRSPRTEVSHFRYLRNGFCRLRQTVCLCRYQTSKTFERMGRRPS